jgi:hypothetical protein
MTTLTVPARPEEDASLPPVPWRRMAWVTWRQHRLALAGAAVVLGALAVYLWLTGLQLHNAYAAAIACHAGLSAACSERAGVFNSDYVQDSVVAIILMQAAPALVGAFIGAPVLAREMETGAFRYAWTQGIGRWRWTLGKLVPLAIALAAATGALSVLFSWYYQPLFAEGFMSPLAPIIFGLRGVAFAAWTLAAFAIGALAGMLIRRTVAAIAATLAVYGGLALAAGMFLRQHYMTPLVSSDLNMPRAAWIMRQWATKGGKFAFNIPQKSGIQAGLLQQYCPSAPPSAPPSEALGRCLSSRGYTQWTSYQPVGRFWPFQWIEGGWLLALSVLLIAATVWLVRRRAA